MPVGTGSINRAARTNKKVSKPEVAEQAAPVEVTANAQVAKEQAKKEATLPKTTQKGAAVKAATAKVTTQKTTAKKSTAVKKKETTVPVVGNECCQLTQELPIHLL